MYNDLARRLFDLAQDFETEAFMSQAEKRYVDEERASDFAHQLWHMYYETRRLAKREARREARKQNHKGGEIYA